MDELMTLLACPLCKTPLRNTGEHLVCSQCGQVYQISPEGVPLLLSRAARQLVEHSLDASPLHAPQARAASRWKTARRVLSPPSPSLNTSGRRVERLFEENLKPGSRILFVGGFRPADAWTRERYRPIVLDILPPYDVAGDGHELPFLNDSLDAVVLQAVLEHVPRPATVVSEARRVLKPGGLVYVSVPFIQSYHYGPLDYQRFTTTGLETLLCSFIKLESGVALGPSSALAWVLKAWAVSFSDHPGVRRIISLVAGWLVFPIKYADFYLAHKKHAHFAAGGVYFVGAKEQRSCQSDPTGGPA